MGMTRRQITKGVGVAALGRLAVNRALASVAESNALPARLAFATPQYEVCLNNARWHPLSDGAKQAILAYLEYKQRGIWAPPDEVWAAQKDVKAAFAGLIHADPTEIAYVTSTTAAENFFVAALGFPSVRGNIVTDALHFEGSLYLYEAMQRQGVDVRVVRPKEWQVTTEDLAAAVDKNTRLVAVSMVSYINGFEHDIKAVCDLAHAHGALVYADAVQAAGAIPIDTRASGVDALACASYKWLMGDMGLGFLYVRQDVLPKLKRTQFGYRQLGTLDYHVFPWDKPGPYPIEYKERPDTAGMFEMGTYDNATVAALSYSIPYLQRLGVERIQEHAQGLLGPLKAELPRLGYPLITPAGSRASIASFLVSDLPKTEAALKKAKVDVSLQPGRMRISPSIYNDEKDIHKLLNALS